MKNNLWKQKPYDAVANCEAAIKEQEKYNIEHNIFSSSVTNDV